METMMKPRASQVLVALVDDANLPAVMEQKFQPSTNLNMAEVKQAMATVDLADTNTITRFGYKVSEATTAISREMMDGVRNKDSGPVGDVMGDMMLELQGLDPDSIEKGGMLGWLKSRAAKVAAFKSKFDTVNGQIETMKGTLIGHQTTLMTSVANMDRLYMKTEQQFHDLEVYIVAGERLLEDLNDRAIPHLSRQVDAGTAGEDGTPAALMPQKLADLQNRRDQLERKVHDLKLVRMVTLQAMPKIRLTQDTDNALIAKIDSIVTTTIPIWYQEMAIAIEQAKAAKATEAVSSVTDATNEMLMKGADKFKQATLDARHAVEQSVVGIDAVKYQNERIIETINEAVQIAKEGKAARAEADQVLAQTENALRAALKHTA